MRIKKGFTLLEVILTLALIAIVLTIPFNFFMFGNKVQNLSMTEADIQGSTRLAAEYINNVTRFATKTHTIPQSSFQNTEEGVRDPNTSYIGIRKNGDLVIDKPGATVGGPRVVQMLAEKQDGIEYEIIFNQVKYDKDGNATNGEEAKLDTLLNFSIVGKKGGKIVTEVISNIEVLNALNIDHLGTPSDPAVALAFSMIQPGSQEWIEVSPDAYITMVIDTSGSMVWDMNGKKNNIALEDKRITILKNNAQKMIDRLANMDFDIYVSLVPFSNDADNPKDFHNVNVEGELALIKAEIEALDAVGATNTGDGMRRAYYQLENETASLISSGKTYADFTQHMMVLVDGATNTETYKENSTGWIWRPSGPIYTGKSKTGTNKINVRDPFVRSGFLSYTYYGTKDNDAYVNKIGNDLIKSLKHPNAEGVDEQVIKTFVIGFSNDKDDHVSLNSIGTAVNGKMFEHKDKTKVPHLISHKPYVIATNAGELDFAFEQFEAEVENSLWIITRPQLKP